MARSHLKVYLDFEERAAALNDEEKGRLLLAMHRYARDGAEPEMNGNERFVWPFFKMVIDHDIELYEAKVEHGKKGGRPAKPQKTTENHSEPEITKKEEKGNLKEEKGNMKEETGKKKDEKGNKNTPSPEGDEGAAGFEDFWLIYPRKQGKQDARKAWEKLAPNGELLFRIQAAVLAQKQSGQWTREGGRYIPLPATWLNGRRWEDEAGPTPAQEKQKTVSAQQYTQRVYTEAELLAVSDDLFEEARKYRTTSPENQTPA